MIVNRREFSIKGGRMDEAVAWFRALVFPKPIRLQQSASGTFGLLAIEIEYESMAEYEKLMAEWVARPDTPGRLTKWNELAKGGQNEFWRTIE